MNLYPQDLRDRQHALLISYRASGEASAPATLSPPPRLGRMGCFWKSSLPLTDREAAIGFRAASARLFFVQWGVPILAAVPMLLVAAVSLGIVYPPNWMPVAEALTVWSVFTAFCMTLLPRLAFRGLYSKPLSLSETVPLLPPARSSDIDLAYMHLVRETIKQPVPADAARSLREALRALGRAVDSLPPASAPLQDTQTLHKKARDTIALAHQEPDEIIAASLKRQADALTRRAQALDRAAPTEQRTRTLRDEVEAQIDALRAGLLDFSTIGGGATPFLLAALAADAHRVADEAASVAAARLELDSYITTPQADSLKAGRK